MNNEYIEKLESVLSDIKDNREPEIVQVSLDKLSEIINNFFNEFKNKCNEYLTQDIVRQDLETIYGAEESGEYEYNTIFVPNTTEAINNYREYLEGFEDYIKTVFNVNDNETDSNIINEKLSGIYDKNEEYINTLFTNKEMNISGGIKTIESMVEFIQDINDLREECLILSDAIRESFNKHESEDLFVIKLSASIIYIHSVMTFVSNISFSLKANINRIIESLNHIENPYIEKPDTSYKMF